MKMIPTLTAPDSRLMPRAPPGMWHGASSVLAGKDRGEDLGQEVVEHQDRDRADDDGPGGGDADPAAAAGGVETLIAAEQHEGEPEEGGLQETLHYLGHQHEFFELEDELTVVDPLPDHR